MVPSGDRRRSPVSASRPRAVTPRTSISDWTRHHRSRPTCFGRLTSGCVGTKLVVSHRVENSLRIATNGGCIDRAPCDALSSGSDQRKTGLCRGRSLDATERIAAGFAPGMVVPVPPMSITKTSVCSKSCAPTRISCFLASEVEAARPFSEPRAQPSNAHDSWRSCLTSASNLRSWQGSDEGYSCGTLAAGLIVAFRSAKGILSRSERRQ